MNPFLDTSVLVRYMTGDPPAMAERARQIIDGTLILAVTEVVLAETAHVLLSYYGVPRETVVDHLINFLQKENIVTHGCDKGLVVLSLLRCRPSGRISIPDALIWAAARSSGVTVIYSFDRRFPAVDIEVRDR
jgi:predicted nucleic acid-binding protein